jgi:hypothetical protein
VPPPRGGMEVNMRSAFIGILIFIIMLLGACSFLNGGGRELLTNEKGMAEERMGQIMNAIDSEEKDALINLFSQIALSEASDFDATTDSLINLCKGQEVSWAQDHWGSSESDMHGKKSLKVLSWYNVTINENIFDFF